MSTQESSRWLICFFKCFCCLFFSVQKLIIFYFFGLKSFLFEKKLNEYWACIFQGKLFYSFFLKVNLNEYNKRFPAAFFQNYQCNLELKVIFQNIDLCVMNVLTQCKEWSFLLSRKRSIFGMSSNMNPQTKLCMFCNLYIIFASPLDWLKCRKNFHK